jgi:hypothetical protein
LFLYSYIFVIVSFKCLARNSCPSHNRHFLHSIPPRFKVPLHEEDYGRINRFRQTKFWAEQKTLLIVIIPSKCLNHDLFRDYRNCFAISLLEVRCPIGKLLTLS